MPQAWRKGRQRCECQAEESHAGHDEPPGTQAIGKGAEWRSPDRRHGGGCRERGGHRLPRPRELFDQRLEKDRQCKTSSDTKNTLTPDAAVTRQPSYRILLSLSTAHLHTEPCPDRSKSCN